MVMGRLSSSKVQTVIELESEVTFKNETIKDLKETEATLKMENKKNKLKNLGEWQVTRIKSWFN